MTACYNIYIDGDNICLENYFNKVHPQIEQICNSNPYDITVICQSNIIFKFKEARTFEVKMICCKTKNKNATDARIIYNAGISVSKGNNVVIVSNDKIFEEIADDKITLITYYPFPNQPIIKLRKRNVVSAINTIKKKYGPSYDVILSDLQEFFPTYKLIDIRIYIEKLVSVYISSSDCVYIKY